MRNQFIIAVLVVLTGLPCLGGPSKEELKYFRAVAPDYSVTSGGWSPAVSPDGQRAAFYSANRDVYVADGLDNPDDNMIQAPWKLDFPVDEKTPEVSYDYERARDIDWSADGKRIAFVGRDGSFYVAEELDGKKKTARVRVVARQAGEDGEARAIVAPRWSPDGAQIAYLRFLRGSGAKVCVLDVASGRERVLATDAMPGMGMVANNCGVWGQPWSPDGKHLVYATGHGVLSSKFGLMRTEYFGKKGGSVLFDDEKAEQRSCGIAVVSVDGKEKRKLECGDGGMYPSWSPVGDRIAFTGPIDYSFEISDQYMGCAPTSVIWVTDIRGKTRTALSNAGLLSPEEEKDVERYALNAVRLKFIEEHGSQLTAAQLARVKADKASVSEMITMLSGIYAKAGNAEKAAQKAGNDFWLYICGVRISTYKNLRERLRTIDSSPVWSPDGKSIAFVREPTIGAKQLVTKDLETGSTRIMATEDNIESVSWARTGRLLMGSSRVVRLKFHRDSPTVSGTGMWYGYSEVWVMDPR